MILGKCLQRLNGANNTSRVSYNIKWGNECDMPCLLKAFTNRV